ncbi:dihydroorotase [bacterium]|nr:MAG: dihydroorotase [bacterium]RKZ16767.1 MAG: dihydroorotase [bacterium]
MELTLATPFDAHVHLRDGVALETVVPHVARDFGRALVMPNLKPPVTTVDEALAYRQRIVEHQLPDQDCQWLMSLYLTDNTSPAEVERAAAEDAVVALKLYPAGATTNSDHGVTDYARIDQTLAAMAENDLLLLVHGESTGPTVDIFDREARFLDDVLAKILIRHPALKVVLEHVTTAEGVNFVEQGGDRVAGTITPQHLLYNRNDLLVGGLHPHLYCLPVLKRERHRQALLAAATGGSPRFFLGTDSAPHPREAKECADGCAGCYSSPLALALYAEAFETAGALDRLEGFASHFGTDFYGLQRTSSTITLKKSSTPVSDSYAFGDDSVVPLRAGGEVGWRVLR